MIIFVLFSRFLNYFEIEKNGPTQGQAKDQAKGQPRARLAASQGPWLRLETMLCLNCVFWLVGQNPMNFRNGDASFFVFVGLEQESPGTLVALVRGRSFHGLSS